MASSDIFLSVIIPAYNELDNFKAGKLDEVDQYLSKQTYTWEVIVVDDGSVDATAKHIAAWIKSKPNWHLITAKHHGKARTVSAGIKHATGQIKLFTDFDQATPIWEVEKVIAKQEQGFQVIIGSREAPGASRTDEPFIRHLMGRVFNYFVKIIAVRNVDDTQCGFKAFTSDVATDLFSSLVVYKNHSTADAYMGAFDVELIFLARKRGYKITQIPVTWKYVHSTRVNPAKDSIRMLVDIFKIRWAYLIGKYSRHE